MVLEKLIKAKEIKLKGLIIFAIICGIVTGIILDIQLQDITLIKDSSLFNIGICFEFWVFATMIIVSRTKKPLEAAFKVSLFFLISQPLVYLIKVPVDGRGWGVFFDYKGWFVWTILTIPGAFIAWFTNKKNNMSIAIYMVAIIFLSLEFAQHFRWFVGHFPYQFIACTFILFQIAAYVLTFDGKRRIVFGILSIISIITVTVLYL